MHALQTARQGDGLSQAQFSTGEYRGPPLRIGYGSYIRSLYNNMAV